MFLLAIVPLIVYLKVIPLSGAAFDFWTGQKENLDFFSYYKMIWIIVCSILSVGAFALSVMSTGVDKIKLSLYYIPIAIYAFFVILSTEFSQYTDISLTGFTDRYEGMYVLLAYMAVLFVTINLVKTEQHIKVLVGALITGALIIGVIGVLQYFGYDFFKSTFGKDLILPASYQNIADKLQFQFSKGMIYATLYHLDYVGSYMAMLFPLSFTLFLLTKRVWLKVLFAAFSLLMAINWLGCTSRAGLFGGFVALILLMIMMNRYIFKNWKFFIGGIVILCLIVFGLNYTAKGYLGSRIHSLISDVTKVTEGSGTGGGQASSFLQGLTVKGNEATITTLTDTLKIEVNNGQISFNDKDNHPIAVNADPNTGKIVLQDNRYKDYNISTRKIDNMNTISVERGMIKLVYKISNNQIALLNNKGNVVNLQPVEKWGFQGKELLGSSRGYIWSRSIPLLKHTLFIGYGPDTFAIYFPQNDLVGKYYAYNGDMWQIVDKPHDFYLQVGINTGIISLLALLSLFIAYFIKSVKLYIRNNYDDFASRAGVGVFVAVFGYLGAAFFNDSIVSVAPVFWILLGLGISINYMLEHESLKHQLVSGNSARRS